ncbi:hypothetical protein FRX31_005814 [Thalictrum thalictroides]|uniref:H15 domain-containing protein n=1 Tax=Thalictrum thalictroides TaxID=46969 RepID=A0A7J6X4F1_THATH|nr:hypothetical protein FRX31_005814 [Thalictrum thalictroides]
MEKSSNVHYSQMVLKAVRELNEKDGSKEEAIMKYIETTYNESPNFFLDILKYNLKSLIKDGDIELTPESTYILAGHYERLRMEEFEAKLKADPRSIFVTYKLFERK